MVDESDALPEAMPRREILADLRQRGFHASARRGQNFLFDTNLLLAFLEDSQLQRGERVLEVGPGAGTLTRHLLARDCRVLAVEIESCLVEYLSDTFESFITVQPPRLEIVEGDVLQGRSRLGAEVLERLAGDPFRLIANLPYAIATILILRLVESCPHFEGFGVLVQRELADRWVAAPGSRTYSAISVVLSLAGEGRITRSVGRNLFTPAPRVDSCFVTWRRNATPFQEIESTHRWARSLFLRRRKMLRNLLREAFDEEDPWWAEQGLSPMARPESLTPLEFKQLAGELDRRGLAPPA